MRRTRQTGTAIAVLFCLLLMACRTTQPVVTTHEEQTDSVTDVTTDREYVSADSTYVVSGDSARARALVLCDSLGNAYLAELQTEHGKRIKAELELERMQNGHGLLLNVECKEDSLEIIITKQREVIKQLKSELVLSSKSTDTVEPVEVVPAWAYAYKRAFWWLLSIVLAVALGVAAYFVGSKSTWGKAALTAIKLFFKWH